MNVLISTLGCKVNHADSEELAARYISNGHSLVGEGEPADICIVNTCTVTAKADSECRNEIRRLRRMYPNAKIVVTGCYVNVAGEEIKKMSEVDELLKTGDTHLITETFELSACPRFLRSRPQLKIQDGCDNFCAYCIVPYARGGSRSVSPDEVLKRVEALKEGGHPEVVLTGIHLGGYGADLEPKTSLLDLLKRLANDRRLATSNSFRIRLSSIDPDEFAPELIEFISGSGLICPHFHIPLQSGDDDVLRAMGRKYTVAEYRALVKSFAGVRGQRSEIRSQRSDVRSRTSDSRLPTSDLSGPAIGTDIIVGFPGETRESFERTHEFLESLPLAYLHVFPYSKRKLTAASKLKETVTAAEKKERAKILRELSDVKMKAFYALQIGKKLDVVIERRRDKGTGLLKGISGNYVPVHFEGPDEMMGQMAEVVVLRVEGDIVYGSQRSDV